MHELVILLLTLFLIYLIKFIIKTPIIYLIKLIIIIVLFLIFGLCLLYVTLKRLIFVPQCCNCHYFATLVFLI